jgi:serine/threonine protein kinase/Tfp pilus assembly protein PilF
MPPVLELETGALFAGRYQVIEKIGTGGMGRVFKAFDTKIREKIAIKLLKAEIAFDEKTIERFRSEIRLARRIAHKNVCRMFDLGEYAGIHYITMELVPGESLKSIIRMTAPLSIPTAVHYAKEICEGLEEAHRWSVIHRDLKPQNIMVDPRGTVRIMDFGIARSVQPTGQTDQGIAVGTPEYMSPEQAEGQKIDQRTDIYALGIVLYEMVTGKVPFEGETTLSILRKHEIEQPQPPRELNPLVPERLNRLILKCLEKSRERRYQNAGEILQELGTIQTTSLKAVEAKARTTRRIPLPESRTRVYRAAGIGLGIVVLAVGGYFAMRHWILRPGPPKPPQTSPVVSEPKKFIAILPFDLSSPDAKYANLGKDLAESIRTRLSISEARVLSPYSSEAIQKSQNRPAETIKANVDRYLQGTLRVDQGTVSISIKLIDAGSESIVWAKEYTEKLTEIYSEVPDKISMDIARQLRTSLGGEQLQALRKHGTANLDAYIAVVNGREATNKYSTSEREEDFSEALKLIRGAIGLDPGYALAYRSLGDLYEVRFVATDKKADLEAMIAAYRKAYDLDPAVPQVHAGLGWAYFHQEKFDQAYKAFKTALSYDPGDATANRDAGSFLRSVGLDEPAAKHYEIAAEADPLEPVTYYLSGACYMSLGDYRKSEAKFNQALALSPDDVAIRLWYIRLLIVMGRQVEAEKELNALESVAVLSPSNRASVGYRRALILALRGDREKALSLIRGNKESYRLEITNIYGVLGMKTDAVRNIKWGNEEGFRLIKDYLYPYPYLITNPFFKSLADDPGFQAVVRNEKERHDAKLKKYGDL